LADQNTKTDELMTVAEAAEYLKVTPKTVYRWLNEGSLPGAKIGGNTWRVSREELERWFRPQAGLRVVRPARPVTAEWLEKMARQRAELLEQMGGVPFKGDEIERMIDEGRK